MNKSYYSLGLMSGTSMDGVDASIIQTDGKSQYNALLDKYYEYPKEIYRNLANLRVQINNLKDLKKCEKKIKSVEKQITIFHAKVVNDILKSEKKYVDFLGFHGQTIFHSAKDKISKQLGDAKLLSKLTKKKVVYNFRKNDLIKGGEGAPLTPVFHKLIVEQKKIKTPVIILNIGGISNITSIINKSSNNRFMLSGSKDIGPGNCLIDRWIRLKSNKKHDEKGLIARSGTVDKFLLNQSLDNFYKSKLSKKKSYDINDFDLSFVRGLSIENGAATLTEYTADICSKKLIYKNIYISGGGRKNTFLVERIKKKIKGKIKLIDHIGINGDYVESQAFAYLAIRSYLKLPISFPQTTGCRKSCAGGIVIKNY